MIREKKIVVQAKNVIEHMERKFDKERGGGILLDNVNWTFHIHS